MNEVDHYREVLCRGEECPNREQCKHYVDYVNKARDLASVSRCRHGKMFIRAVDDHPQHNKA